MVIIFNPCNLPWYLAIQSESSFHSSPMEPSSLHKENCCNSTYKLSLTSSWPCSTLPPKSMGPSAPEVKLKLNSEKSFRLFKLKFRLPKSLTSSSIPILAPDGVSEIHSLNSRISSLSSSYWSNSSLVMVIIFNPCNLPWYLAIQSESSFHSSPMEPSSLHKENCCNWTYHLSLT